MFVAIAVVGSSLPSCASITRSHVSVTERQRHPPRIVSLLREREILQRRGLNLAHADNYSLAAVYLKKVLALDGALGDEVPPCTSFEDFLNARATQETRDAILLGKVAKRQAHHWFMLRVLNLFFSSNAKTPGFAQCKAWERRQRRNVKISSGTY